MLNADLSSDVGVVGPFDNAVQALALTETYGVP
jgi:hypothetical protein